MIGKVWGGVGELTCRRLCPERWVMPEQAGGTSEPRIPLPRTGSTMGPKPWGSGKFDGVGVCGGRWLVKKSGIQTHRVAAVRAKAVAGSSGLALSLAWVGGGVGAGKGGGPSRGDCETGIVSVSLRGSSGGGSSGRQPGKGVGVSAGPQEAALPLSPQTGSWGPPSTPPDLGTPSLVCACWGHRKCVGGRRG